MNIPPEAVELIKNLPPEAVPIAWVLGAKVMSKPILKLIETVSPAFGKIYSPIAKVIDAKAEVKAEKISALGKLEIEEAVKQRKKEIAHTLEQRALDRSDLTRNRQQLNIENIVRESAEILSEHKDDSQVSDEKVDEDWLFQFFESSQNISDEEMRSLWAKILAGEVLKPKSFSLRALHFVKTMDKSDAELFNIFCNYCFRQESYAVPESLLYIPETVPYLNSKGLSAIKLGHLQSIGLIIQHGIIPILSSSNITVSGGYSPPPSEGNIILHYGENKFALKLKQSPQSKATIANLTFHHLTAMGKELFPLCHYIPDDEYLRLYLNSDQINQFFTVENL